MERILEFFPKGFNAKNLAKNVFKKRYKTCVPQVKTSGTEVNRTLDVKLRFVGFISFFSFNFGQIQKIRFIVVMVWSS